MSFKSEIQERLRKLYNERRHVSKELDRLNAQIAEIETLAPEIAKTVEDANPIDALFSAARGER